MTEHASTDAYQRATAPSRCAQCGGQPTSNRHYPATFGKPVNRYYCAPCDNEWWVEA